MFYNPDGSLYLIGLIMFLGLAATAMHGVKSPMWLLISGIGITALGTFFGYDIGNLFPHLATADNLSQSFIVFISVLGGGIVSSACAEIRHRRNRELNASNNKR